MNQQDDSTNQSEEIQPLWWREELRRADPAAVVGEEDSTEDSEELVGTQQGQTSETARDRWRIQSDGFARANEIPRSVEEIVEQKRRIRRLRAM